MTTPQIRSLSLSLPGLVLAAWCGLFTSASAQTDDPWAGITASEQQEQATPDEQTSSSDTSAAIETTTPDIDWEALNANFAALTSKQAKLKEKKSAVATADPWSWTRSNNPDGSAAVAIKQPISPFWDTRVGADLNVTTQMPTTSWQALYQKVENQSSQSSGSAWAAMTAPGLGFIWDKTAIEARTDPTQDQSKFGTTLSKSLPLWSDQYSLTLQNGYNVTQQALVPVFGLSHSVRTYELDQTAKISFAGTGTSLIAGQTHSTADDKWLRRIGAEQQLFGGVSVTGTVSETPDGIPNSSLTAGFKRTW
ncbi:hypothetical protein [Bradyrhizobium sp. SYSU BS000235]|uniref:hypothetical protein n=1 Tax=Bradyrhizobium sp. SYSU BS000235 TaxID=3411332 RepID=UPI003C71C716